MLELRHATIVGATGPTGWHLAQALEARGCAVRVVSRSRANLERVFPEPRFEKREADATDAEATRAALEGTEVAFDCIGLPPAAMHLHPVTARALAEAAGAVGARVVQVSSFWAYLPVRYLPLDEEHPREGGPEAVRLRRAAEDALQAAGAAVAHLPDFFGPRVHTSTLQNPLRDFVSGGAANGIGEEDVEREYAYLPDAMAAVAELARHEAAYGERWIVPGAGPLSLKEAIAIAARHLDRPARLRCAGPRMLRFLSLFLRELRPMLPLVPHYASPMLYDGAKLRGLIGAPATTPYERSIPATVDWLRAR